MRARMGTRIDEIDIMPEAVARASRNPVSPPVCAAPKYDITSESTTKTRVMPSIQWLRTLSRNSFLATARRLRGETSDELVGDAADASGGTGFAGFAPSGRVLAPPAPAVI